MSYVEEMQARRAAEASERERAARAKAMTPDGKLKAAERDIDEAIGGVRRSFEVVGARLRTIRDGKLYQGKFETFEAYCAARWPFSRQQAYRLMDGADVLASLSPLVTNGGLLPANEAQARPLVALPPAERAEAWAEAVQTAPPSGITAAHVEAVVRAKRPKAHKQPKQAPCPTCGCTSRSHRPT